MSQVYPSRCYWTSEKKDSVHCNKVAIASFASISVLIVGQMTRITMSTSKNIWIIQVL